MNRPVSSAQLNTASGSFSYFENTPSAESGTTCQARYRDVVKVAVNLSAMRTGENITNYLHQPTVRFCSPFDNPAYKKRAITVIYSRPEEDQPLNLLVRKEPRNNDQAPTLVIGNKPFSIRPILGMGKSTSQIPSVADNNLYPMETSSQNCINTSYKMAIPVAIIGPKVNVPGLQHHDVPVQHEIGSSSDLTKGSEETSASSSSKIMHEKERKRERQRERQRERYQNDPAFAARKRELQRERKRKRYQNDPAYAEHERERQKKRRKNPAVAERDRECQRKCQRRRYQNDPAYAERQRVRQRVRQRELRKDPAYVERQRVRQRVRYQNDPAFAERRRKRNRDRYQNDPVYAESRRIYSSTYNKMKNKSGRKEASKLASVAREQYLQSVNSPEDSSNLPQTSNPAEVTQNSNSYLDACPLISSQTE